MSGITKLTVAGWKGCRFFVKAANVAASLEHLFPGRVTVAIMELPDRDSYRKWLPTVQGKLGAPNHTSSPISWVGDSDYVGGCDDTLEWGRTNFIGAPGGARKRAKVTNDNEETKAGDKYDYDLVVIGGGSGGLACSKEAAQLGAKVAVLDYVKPSTQGTTWGLGGTCVNVGCIPKKLMHTAALLGETLAHDANEFGWNVDKKAATHDWSKMVENVQGHISKINWGQKVDLHDKGVEYINKLGTFVDPHTLSLSDPYAAANEFSLDDKKEITARRFVVAVGGRPRPLDCPGGEHAITSDDVFSLDKSPGKTLCVGAAYIALECAGFLNGLGLDTTVMVRSILLRGFDRECAGMIGEYMKNSGISFVEGAVPSKIEKQANGKLLVTWNGGQEEYDTVLAAIGRNADTGGLSLDKAGVVADKRSGKLKCDNEQTNVPHVYAIGDVVLDRPELTPVAIQAGRLLARRLYGDQDKPMDYVNVCTTVFTPLEYGCCGLNEEEAIEEYGADGVEVFHSKFTPLEWTVPDARPDGAGFCKLVCVKADDMRVAGFHYLGPNAGEVTQGVGVAIKLGATYDHFCDTVGIHPTCAEQFTTLSVTKSSGASAEDENC